jgi:3D (Asp-Asp-Asp) domain-containing protein
VVRSRAVGERGLAPRGLLVLTLLAFAGLLLAAEGAGSPATLHRDAQNLRAESSSASRTARAARLSVVTLDTRLEQTQAALLRLGARREAIARARADAEQRLRLARRNLRISEQRLASRLRALYEHGEADPLAVVLGASSMGEALEGLDGVNRVAQQDRALVQATKAARARLAALTRRLSTREAEIRRAEDAAAATAVALATARAERAAMVARLSARARAGFTRAASLEAEAEAVAAAQPSTAPASPAAGTRTLTVTATGYALRGRTATGVSVGWGIVAVDPSVIPFGTRISIPGYGEGVAADTGGAVRGARIDLWFPTQSEALAWGSRTITITLL